MAEFNRTDLEFILTQIKMAEAGQPPVNPHLAFGLREVAGTNNSVVPGQEDFGSAGQPFPRVTDPYFRTVVVNVDGTIFDPNPGVDGDTITTTYESTDPSDAVIDSDPRTISNLISDQSVNNAAAVEAAEAANEALGTGYQPEYNPNTPTGDDSSLFINNVTTDAGLSAPFNTWMTLFGQFFDHGLDHIEKGDSGTIFIPLQPDDPLYVEGSPNNFMVLTRATNLPGADGVLGTADDIHEGTNLVTPFVDQNQTYSSHPSHQVFLREYAIGIDGKLHSTGNLLAHVTPGSDGVLGTADDVRGLATWADLKANAFKLGIKLTDADVNGVPLLATDAYGNVILGPNGFALVVVRTGNGADGIAGTGDDTTTLLEGNAQGLDLNDTAALGGTVVRTGIAFIDDKNRNADPFGPQTEALLTADADTDVGNQPQAGTYDNELLDAHYVAGDGRINENLGLTAVHEIFHSEHDRLVEQTKALVRSELANGDTSFALEWVLPGADLSDGIQDNEWNGERLFQAAKFGTETQYQHLAFEEFARKIAPNIHLFGNVDINLDPAITAEFANVVYRFGHSMLNETLNIDADPDAAGVQQMSLIEAFTNPLGYLAQGTDAAANIITGSVNQVANEIDEFVTGALRNNLLGLPLDLAAINIARGRDTGVAPLNLVRNQIYSQIQDTNLKPYESWAEFGQFLKHAASLINFVAAYGTHASILGAATLEAKRAAALQLVADGLNEANAGTDAYDFMHSLGAYANNVDHPLAVHAEWSTGSITGLDNVDLWIGGLAEKQTAFGGLLGSTFQFIFETQLEALQDGDRFYYLPRLEGLHFESEIEANSFAELIMNNTDARHLPGDVFLTPEYVIEASTITDDPSTWLRNPETGELLVERLADGTIHFIGDDNFLGNTIVLGGTEGGDRLVAGHADDDTVWGDGGNDYLDGGDGADFLFGGDGDDLITDTEGDDTIRGDAGNDTVSAGRGDDIIFGGDGNDFIDTGLSGPLGVDTASGGLGNDIIVGGDGDDEIAGNEGDDWIEGGDGGDLIIGDQGAPTGQVPLIQGNDVLVGGATGDRMQGFSGDDIMTGEGGFDRFEGGLGFDWASFELEDHGVSIDMNRKEFVDTPQVPGGDAIRDRFVETEGASGTAFADYLRGTDVGTGNPLGTPGFDDFNELQNVNLITGLADYFPLGPVAFSDGNIIFGGGGSDFIEGRGGNDIIDGDARLHVELTSHSAGGQIIREIRYDQVNAPVFDEETFTYTSAGDIDVAVFSDLSTNYQINLATDPLTGELLFGTDGNPVLQVVHTPAAGGVDDGTDTLYAIERLQFADITIENPFLQFVTDLVAQGALVIDDLAPVVGDTISVVSSTINDFEGVLVEGVLDPATAGFDRIDIPLDYLSLQWQYLDPDPVGGNGPQWINIAGATDASFVVTDFLVGAPLRVLASFTDGLGVLESVASAQTANVNNNPAVNNAPTIVTQVPQPGLPDTTGREDTPLGTPTRPGFFLPLTTVFTDDLTPSNQLVYTATLANGDPLDTMGLAFEVLLDANGLVTGGRVTGTPPPDFSGPIDIRVKATDQGGLSVTDTFTINVLPANDGPASLTVEGTAAQGSTLTAVLGPDPDGSGTAPVLQWLRDGVAIQGARSATYVLTAADVGRSISVSATYTDGQGFAETVTSDATEPVAASNVAPEITSNGGTEAAALSVAENSTAVTVVSATDANADTTITYSIAGGADAALFSIDASTGALSFIGMPDFEAAADAGGDNVYDVIVSASDGSLADTQAISVAVTDVPGVTLTGTAAANTLTGTDERDVLNGRGGDDVLGGAGGDDTLDGGNGADVMTGGTGNDTYVVNDAGDQAIEDVDGGTDTVSSLLDAYALGANVENLTFIGTGDFSGAGNELGNAMIGGLGNDTLDGGAGAGADMLEGGDGDDTLLGRAGDDDLRGGAGADTLRGGAGGDVLRGNGGADRLLGGTGDDSIIAGVGDDTVEWSAGDGRDIVDGDGGTDTFLVSGSADDETFWIETVADYVARTSTDPSALQAETEIVFSRAVGNEAGGIVAELRGIDDINVDGVGGNDTFVVSGDFAGTDLDPNTIRIFGSAGNDTLDIAGRISDQRVVFEGGGGSDDVVGDVRDTDVLELTAGEAQPTQTLALDEPQTLPENEPQPLAENEAQTPPPHHLLGGTDGNDWIFGTHESDFLYGGAGDDIMMGKAGSDAFVFAPGFGNDVILGFDANAAGGQDLLDLSGLGITADTFADSVTITEHCWFTQVSVGDDTIALIGVHGGASALTQHDFLLA